MNGRIDMYRVVHKGIRAELLGFLLTLGREDLGSDVGARALQERFHRLVFLLERHAQHEDAFYGPVIRSTAPALALALEHDHRVYDQELAGLEKDLSQLVTAATVRRAALAHRLYVDLEQFSVRYLVHLSREESEGNVALWRAFSDEELDAIHRALVGSIPPPEMSQWLEIMLPAINLDERTELLAGMRASAPPEAFSAVERLARKLLAEADFDALEARLRAA